MSYHFIVDLLVPDLPKEVLLQLENSSAVLPGYSVGPVKPDGFCTRKKAVAGKVLGSSSATDLDSKVEPTVELPTSVEDVDDPSKASPTKPQKPQRHREQVPVPAKKSKSKDMGPDCPTEFNKWVDSLIEDLESSSAGKPSKPVAEKSWWKVPLLSKGLRLLSSLFLSPQFWPARESPTKEKTMGRCELQKKLQTQLEGVGRKHQLLQSTGCPAIDRACKSGSVKISMAFRIQRFWRKLFGLSQLRPKSSRKSANIRADVKCSPPSWWQRAWQKLFGSCQFAASYSRREWRTLQKSVHAFAKFADNSAQTRIGKKKRNLVVTPSRLEICEYVLWCQEQQKKKDAAAEAQKATQLQDWQWLRLVRQIISSGARAAGSLLALLRTCFSKSRNCLREVIWFGMKPVCTVLTGLLNIVRGGFIDRRAAKRSEVKQVFVKVDPFTLPVNVKPDLSDSIPALKRTLGLVVNCSEEQVRLSYGGRDLTQGTLQSNYVPEGATLVLLDRVKGGGNADPKRQQQAEKLTKRQRRKKPDSLTAAQRKAKSRMKPGQTEAENSQKRTVRANLSTEERAAANGKRTKKHKEKRKKKRTEEDLRRANFDMTEESPDMSFADFEQHPETAILLYLMNSGSNKFSSLDDIDFEAD